MRVPIASIRFLLLCLIVFAAAAAAQTANGTITGIVSDPTAAVVANAAIEARHEESGQIYRVTSTETGNFSIVQLPVGKYELSVNVQGFKKYTRQGLNLAAAQTMRIDIPLEVGSNTETITVSADATLLKTENSQVAQNVTVTQLTQLPIIGVGGFGTQQTTGLRDSAALMRMLPGVNSVINASMVVNGSPSGTSTLMIEGMAGGNTSNGFKIFTDLGQVGVDAIQEVAVQASNYAAEFGTVGGAVLNYTMKSGTNQYHGSLFDYSVNEILNASQPYTALKNPTRRHDYGGTFGGPIKIPKLYNGTNKTFFFWNYEEFRETVQIKTAVATVPTDAYRVGNFNQLIVGNRDAAGNNRTIQISNRDFIDPLGRNIIAGALFDPKSTRLGVACDATVVPTPTCVSVTGAGSLFDVRDPFPGNQMPQNAAYLDPIAQKILAMVPRPTGPNFLAGQTGNNFQNPFDSERVSSVPSLKIDHQFGSKGHLSFFGQLTGTDSQYSLPFGNAEGFPAPITQARGTFEHAQTLRLNYDYTITPTLLLHLGAGYYGEDFADHAPTRDYDALKELGLKGATLNRQFPVINVGSSGTNFGGMNGLGPVVQSTTGTERRPSGNVNVTWVKGNHTFKLGSEARFEQYPVISTGSTAGNYSFGGGPTDQTALTTAFSGLQNATIRGFPFASFLMGTATGVSLSLPTGIRTAKSQWGLFIQDTWKFNRRLTFDLGLRWDYGTYAKEQYGRVANLSTTVLNPNAGGHPGGSIFEATCNCTFADNYPYAIGPRIGGAYQINSKTVIRGGLGIVYNATSTAAGATSNSANAGNPNFGGWVSLFKDGIPSSVQPRWPVFEPGIGLAPNSIGTAPTNLDRNAGRPARQLQWSLGIQRELNRNLVVEGSYVANRGVWWNAGGLAPVNSMSEQILSKFQFALGNQADGNLLAAFVPNLSQAQKTTLQAKGVVLPYSGFGTVGSPTVLNSLLPFPQYNGNISPNSAPLGKTWYDSLQVSITKRFSHGLSLNANYTFSKTLDLMSSPDIFNRNLGKTYSGNDLPHVLKLTAQYTVPMIRSSNGILGNKFVRLALADWGIGAGLFYQSAPALTRPATQTTVPISRWLGRGPGPAQRRLDANGQPISVWSIDWTDYAGVKHTDPIDINCHCYDPAKTVVLNPNAWVSVPDAQWAADQSVIRDFRAVRQPSENVNFSREFRFLERVTLQVRVEFQNAFNRTRFGVPGSAAINVGNFNTLPTFPAGVPTGFGTINPVSGTSGFRTGVFVGRLQF